MSRFARKVRRALRIARAIIGISAGGLESDESEDENMAAMLDISHSTGLRRRASSQPPPAAPVPFLSPHPSLPDLRELTEAPEMDVAALYVSLAPSPVRPSTSPSVRPSTTPTPVGLTTSPRSTTAAVGERDVAPLYMPLAPPPVRPSTPPPVRPSTPLPVRPSTPLSVRPSTPPTPVGLATPPRSTMAAVCERSQPGSSSGDVNHNTMEMKPNLAVKEEDIKPRVPMFRWQEPPKRVSICFCQTDIFRLTILIEHLHRFSTWQMPT